jgi:hypothetical protein
MSLDEGEVKFHMTNAMAALEIVEKKFELMDRENARWRHEQSLLKGKLRPEAGESLAEAAIRLVRELEAERKLREETENLLRCARRDAREMENKLAGLVKEQETA